MDHGARLVAKKQSIKLRLIQQITTLKRRGGSNGTDRLGSNVEQDGALKPLCERPT